MTNEKLMVHRKRVEEVLNHRKEHASSVEVACNAFGIHPSQYYASRKLLKDKSEPAPKVMRVQTIAAEPIRSASRLVCLIGSPQEIAEVLKL